MSKIVNLRRVRKTHARAQKAARADANAVKFGRSKAQRAADARAADKAARDLDGHQREE